MKVIRHKTVAAAALATIVLTCGVQAELAMYEGFAVPKDYKSGRPLAGVDGGSGFAAAWQVNTSKDKNNINRYKSAVGDKNYSDRNGLKISAESGVMLARSAGTGAGALTRKFQKEQKGTVWFSLLSKLDKQVGYGWELEFLDAKGSPQVAIINGSAKYNRWRLVAAGGSKKSYLKSKEGATPTDLCLLVGKLEGVGAEGNSGSFTIYINPTDLKNVEKSATSKAAIKGISIAGLQTFSFSKKSAATGILDEIRIGSSLSDVVPLK